MSKNGKINLPLSPMTSMLKIHRMFGILPRARPMWQRRCSENPTAKEQVLTKVPFLKYVPLPRKTESA
jgi:hypothetical protein